MTPLPAIRTQDVLVGPDRLRLLVAGEGPPLVLLASMIVSAGTYRPLVRQLARTFRVHVVELPGVGGDAPAAGPRSVEEDARSVASMLDVLQLKGAVVVGHSNSGPVALELARTRPDLVARLFLADTVGARLRRGVGDVLLSRALDGLVEVLFSLRALPAVVTNLRRHRTNFLHQVRQAATIDVLDGARHVTVPTLLAWGGRDATMPLTCAQRLLQVLPRGRLAVGPGRHDWLVTHPRAFARMVLPFALDPGVGWNDATTLDRKTIAERLAREIAQTTDLSAQLRTTVAALSASIGERNLRDLTRHDRLRCTADLIARSFRDAGFVPERHVYEVDGSETENIAIEIPGTHRPDEVVVIGAHYDTVRGSPGAGDNASGVALLLSLARWMAASGRSPSRTLRLVAFSTEEPPHTRTSQMGSFVHAERCRRADQRVVAMLSLETLGVRPTLRGKLLGLLVPALHPEALAIVGNRASTALAQRLAGAAERGSRLLGRALSLPGWMRGASSSGNWSFWQHGYPAVMVTDGGPVRWSHSHRPTDTLAEVDFARLEQLAHALQAAVEEIAWGTAPLGEELRAGAAARGRWTPRLVQTAQP